MPSGTRSRPGAERGAAARPGEPPNVVRGLQRRTHRPGSGRRDGAGPRPDARRPGVPARARSAPARRCSSASTSAAHWRRCTAPGLVHGDVKAQNVMRAAGGRTVLMDFGAGYDVKTDDAAGRRFAGTPLYLAPEVFAGDDRSTGLGHLQRRRAALLPGHRRLSGRGPAPAPRCDASTRRGGAAAAAARRPPGPARRVHPRGRAGHRRVPTGDRYQTAGELEAALNAPCAAKNPDVVHRQRSWRASLLVAVGVVVAWRPWPWATADRNATQPSPDAAVSARRRRPRRVPRRRSQRPPTPIESKRRSISSGRRDPVGWPRGRRRPRRSPVAAGDQLGADAYSTW